MKTRYIIYRNTEVQFVSGGIVINTRMYVCSGNSLENNRVNEWTNVTGNAKKFASKRSAILYMRNHVTLEENQTSGIEEIYL